MLRFCAFFALLVVLFVPAPANACATCSAGDPTLVASGSEQAFEARKRLSLDLRATSERAASLSVAEERLELRFGLALTPSVLITAGLPAMHRSIESLADGARSQELTLGDAELQASSTVWTTGMARVRESVLVFGGAKAPTAPLQTDAHGVPLPVALQPGCGSIVPTLGASFLASTSPLTFVATTSFTLPFQVRDGPHAGDSWRTSATLQFQPARSKIATRFGVSTRIDQAGLSNESDVDPDSGGFVGSVSGELLVSPATDLVLGAGMFAPVLQVLRGSQHEGAIALVSASYDF